MSKRILALKRQIYELQKKTEKRSMEANLDVTVILDFSQTHEDTESLSGYKDFLEVIHDITPTTPDWEWSEEQIQRACYESGLNRAGIIFDECDDTIIFHNEHRR